MCLLRLISYIPEIHSSNHIYAVFSWAVKLLLVRVLHMVFVWWWSGTVFKKQMKDCILWHYRMSPVVSVSDWAHFDHYTPVSNSLKLEMFAQSLIWSIWSPTFGFSRTKGRNNMKFYLKVYHFDILQIVLRWRSIANMAISVLILVQYVCNVLVSCWNGDMLAAEVRNWPPTLTSSYCVVNLLKEEEIRQKGERQIATTTELKRSRTNFFCFTMISPFAFCYASL